VLPIVYKIQDHFGTTPDYRKKRKPSNLESKATSENVLDSKIERENQPLKELSDYV
jgi:hypothetical protein